MRGVVRAAKERGNGMGTRKRRYLGRKIAGANSRSRVLGPATVRLAPRAVARIQVVRTLILGLLIFLPSGQAHSAEDRCPPETAESMPILLREPTIYDDLYDQPLGVDFSTPAYYWDMGTWFRMNFGFFNPWAGRPVDRIMIDRDLYTEWLASNPLLGYDPATGQYDATLIPPVDTLHSQFAFWMPTLRPVERDRWTSVHLRPCEAGRPRPTWDDYVVAFYIDWPFQPGSEAAWSARPFIVAEERLSKGQRLRLQGHRNSEHSLDGPITGTQYYYVFSDDGDLAVHLSCNAFLPADIEKNPICAGYVWQRSLDLALFIKFPSDRGQLGRDERWREPVMAAISLITSWRIEN